MRANTKHARLLGMIQATKAAGLNVVEVEIGPRTIRIKTEAVDTPRAAGVARKAYADWKREEMRNG